MPVYTYKCDSCHEVQDHTHPMAETLELHHCECGEGYLHKIFTPTAVSFKGQGWAGTYGKDKPKGL